MDTNTSRLQSDPDVRFAVKRALFQGIKYETESQIPGEFNHHLVNYQKMMNSVLEAVDAVITDKMKGI